MPLFRRRYKCRRTDAPTRQISRACLESLHIPRNIILKNSRRRTICMSRPQCCSESSSSLSSCLEDNEDDYCTRYTCENPAKCSSSDHMYCTHGRRTTISSLDPNRASSCTSVRSKGTSAIGAQIGCETPPLIDFQTQPGCPQPQPCNFCKRLIENVSRVCEICKNNQNSFEDCLFCKKVKENVLKDCDVCRFTCCPPSPSCLLSKSPSIDCCSPPPPCPLHSSCRPPKCSSIPCCGPPPPCPLRPSYLAPNCPSITGCGPPPPSCLPPKCSSIPCCGPPPSCLPPPPVFIDSTCSPMDCPHAIPLSVTCHFCKKEKEKAQKCSNNVDLVDETSDVVLCPHALPPSACQTCCKKPEPSCEPSVSALDSNLSVKAKPLPIDCKIKMCKHAEALNECKICCNKAEDCDKSQQTSEFVPDPGYSEERKGCGSNDCPVMCTCKIPPAFRQLTPGCTSNISGSCDCGN